MRKHESCIKIGDASVQVCESAHNLMIFDNSLEMFSHTKTVCRASFMQLRHFISIKDTLTWDLLEKVTHAFISLCPDYHNALLYDLPQSSVSKLQCIENAAAGLLTDIRKFNCITPVLKSLH